jgi:aerobic C4-dicarboxylate transport protein
MTLGFLGVCHPHHALNAHKRILPPTPAIIHPMPDVERKPWYQHIYIQVLIAVAIGIVVGAVWPGAGKQLKPLGDGFIALIKMLIAPIVFCTVVHGMASIGDMRKLGRVGIKALVYFEVMSTLALVVGLAVVNFLKPGVGFNAVLGKLDEKTISYVAKAKQMNAVDMALHIIPDTFVGAFVNGDLLQVLLVSVLAAMGLLAMGDRAKPILHAVDTLSGMFMGMLGVVVRLAPVGAFGAMAFTIGAFGFQSLARLGFLMGGFYLTAFVFVFGVLGLLGWGCGFSVWRFVAFIKEELLLVLGTSSSETALPGLMTKLERLGCHRSTVGLVVPAGYSFNLDGTNIYMAMAAVFLAQATNTPLDLPHQIGLLLVAMVTSKGASGVTGAGFIALAATLAVVPGIPIESLALLVGIDRFMSECRSLTNLVGNGVATLVVSRWEGELSRKEVGEALR